MKTKLNLTLAAAALVFANLATAGDVTGTITFKGTPPAEKEITPIKDDPNCAPLYPNGLPKTKFYVVDANGDLADVIVCLKDASGKEITGKSTGASVAPAMLDQKGALYVPQILAIQTGQKLTVKNSDPLVHNVHTKPTANPNPTKCRCRADRICPTPSRNRKCF